MIFFALCCFRSFKDSFKDTHLAVVAAMLLVIVSGCTTTQNAPVALPDAPPPAPKPVLSAEPIIETSKNDVFFAQTALKKLGFDIGIIDGLWGPRSASAIRLFESSNGLTSADGHLSELNLAALANVSGITRQTFGSQAVQGQASIATKLRQQQETPSQGPQLIIVEKTYTVMAKPNPYSSELATLAPGTGVYVLTQQEGNWFEIESINRLRGFIQDN